MAAEQPVQSAPTVGSIPNAEPNANDEIDSYGRVVDIGGDCYFLEPEQRSLKFGCKSRNEFVKTFDQKLYNQPLHDIEYLFGKYLAFGRHQLETFSGEDKEKLKAILTIRIKQLKDSNEYSSSKIINSRMRTYVDNINSILAKLGDGNEVPNNVGNAETFTDPELYQFILELTWFMTHADKVPKQNRKLWNEMIKKMKELKLGTIAEQIRANNSQNSKPPVATNFFKGINTTKMKNAPTLRQAVGDSDTDLRPKFESLLALLRMKGYLNPDNSYDLSMESNLSQMLNMRVVKGASTLPKARTGVARPPPLIEDNTNEDDDDYEEGPPSKKQSSKVAAFSAAFSAKPKPAVKPKPASATKAAASTSGSDPASTVVAAPSSQASTATTATASHVAPEDNSEDDMIDVSVPITSASAAASAAPFTFNASKGFSMGKQGGGNLTLTNQSNDLTTDTLYQLTSPLFDYIRVLFDPVYSILQRSEFEIEIALITIIPLLHVCMNIKLPGIYRILNIDPEVKEFIDMMLGATKQFISTLSSKSKGQFLEQLKTLPRMHLTSLLGSSSNSNHYKDPSTFPAIQFLSLGVNFTVNEEKKEELPDGFFNEECLYLSNTQETSTTNKIKGLFSSNSNKKIKLYTLDWNTIKASKASLDLQNDKKEINPDSLEINSEVLFNDSELFLKTIMIVHHIFPGKDTFTPIEQEEEPEATPEEEPKEEEPKEESTCKTELIAKECTGTASDRKKQYRKQTVVLHPDKHSTNGCEKEATQAFKDLQAMKSCTETNENTVAPSNAVVVPTTNVPSNTVSGPTTNTPLAITNNSVVAPTSTNIVVVPNQVK